jgi:1-aminocyclopropane-1-carboxylate deaminase/D-cysteine desulfhydrase-like pyridoxal-dependent ACC family enzyme
MIQGNLLLDEIVGAELRFIDVQDPWSPEGREIMEAAAAELERQGETPYVVTVQTVHAPLAAIGYVVAAFELYQQLLDRQIDVRYLFTPSGSGVTHAGLILGAKLLHWPVQVVGVSPSPLVVDVHRQRIAEIVERAAHLLGVTVPISLEDVIVEGGYAGAAYGEPTDGAVRAIRVTGESEGLILDPVYSGKAMHALFDWAEQGRLPSDGAVVFLHTGGAPNLFRQAEVIGAAVRRTREEEAARVAY